MGSLVYMWLMQEIGSVSIGDNWQTDRMTAKCRSPVVRRQLLSDQETYCCYEICFFYI